MPASTVNQGASTAVREALNNHAELIDDGVEGAADDVTLENVEGVVSIKAGGVGATQLAANAVTTAKILDGNVTEAKLSAALQTMLADFESRIAALEA